MVAIPVTENLTSIMWRIVSTHNTFARMLSLEYGNNRDNYRGDITHEQPIGKQISYGPYRRIASFSGYF